MYFGMIFAVKYFLKEKQALRTLKKGRSNLTGKS